MPDSTPEGRVTLAVLAEQLAHLVKQVDGLVRSVEHLVDGRNQSDKDLAIIRADLEDLPKFEHRLEKAEGDVQDMKPWVNVWRYVATIAMGMILTGLILGLIWAAIQSRGWLP